MIAALHALAFLSGCAGLVLQITWTRMLSLGVGHEMVGVLAVTTAFFFGWGLGALLSTRILARTNGPLRWYAVLEVLTGAWALLSVWFIPWCNRVVLAGTGIDPSGLRQWSVTFSVPALALLPASAAMGAVFPLLENVAAPLTRNRRCVGSLYAASTLGAVTGVLVPIFSLYGAFGLSRTVALAGGVSLFCGAAGVGLTRGYRVSPSALAADPTWSRSRVPWILAATGLLGIGFEVLAVRVLAKVLENTIYTFTAVLSVYLLGTALGGAIYQRFSKAVPSSQAGRWLLLGAAGSVFWSVGVLARSEGIYRYSQGWLRSGGHALWLAELTTSATVLLLPAIVMGALFSQLVQQFANSVRPAEARPSNNAGLQASAGGGIGFALAMNTLGCALAPVLFGVILLPTLGAKWSFVVIGVGYLVLANPRTVVGRSIGALLLAWTFLLPANLLLYQPVSGDRLISYQEGVSDSVAVVEHRDGNRSLLVDNRFTMGGTGAVLPQRRHASLPLLLHARPKRALFLGLGTGITFAAAGTHGELHADGVELLPEVVQAMPWFAPYNALPNDSERLRVHVSDARRFVRVNPQLYDVIVADLFHPARDGAGALYSLEHFQAIRARLAHGGVVCQWLPLYQLDQSILRVITRTFLDVFPDSAAFLLRFNVDTPVLGLISGLNREQFGPGYFARRAADPALAKELASQQFRDDFQLFGCYLCGPEALRDFTKGARVNTDDHPVVVLGAPASAQSRANPATRLLDLLDWPVQLDWLIPAREEGNRQFVSELSAFIKARNLYLRGLAAESTRARSSAIDFFVESARMSRHFMTGYAECLTVAVQQMATDPQGARALLERLVQARPEQPVAAELLRRLGP